MAELHQTSYPVNELTLSKCKDFLMRKDGLLHNGINVEDAQSILNIADGTILAMRLSDDYIQVGSLKKYENISAGYITDNNLSDKFSQKYNLIEKENSESSSSDNNEKYYFKEETKSNKLFYSLIPDLKDFDKIEALYFLNEIISNNFVLIEHNLKKVNGDEMSIYSLYNHLAPLGRMTFAQKLELFWYEHKLTLKKSQYPCCKAGSDYVPCELIVEKSDSSKEGFVNITWELPGKVYSGEIAASYLNGVGEVGSPVWQSDSKRNNAFEYKDGIAVYKVEKGNIFGSRTLQEIVDVNTEFEFEFNDLKEYTEKYKERLPLKVKYENDKEGYVYLDEKNQYTKDLWKEEIEKFDTVISKEESIEFLNFQIKVGLKNDFNEKDKIFTPKNNSIKKGSRIGFSGFNFMEEDKLANNTVILKDGTAKPFTVHIETFFADNNAISFDYNDEKKWKPFCFKVNSECNVCIEKPTTATEATTDTYDMSLIEHLGEERLYSDEIFYKVKVIAKVIENKNDFIYHDNAYAKYTTKPSDKYTATGKTPVVLYDRKGVRKGYTTSFNTDFYYLCGTVVGESIGQYRRFGYFYEMVGKEYYIKKSVLDAMTKEDGSRIYVKAVKDKHFFIQKKLDSNNLFSSLAKKTAAQEKINASLENSVYLEFDDIKINEYVDQSTNNLKAIWYKTKSSDNKEYWISSENIKTEKNGTPVEVMSYNDWTKGFEILELKDKNKYRIDNYKVNEEDKDKKLETIKKSFNTGKIAVEDSVFNKLIEGDTDRNIIFEHKNEWDNSKDLINAYKNKDKAKIILEKYELFSGVKQNLKKDVLLYTHPFYTVERLEKLIAIPEFNPYEGKKYSEVFENCSSLTDIYDSNRKLINKDYSHFTIISNPGFAPLYDETWSKKNGNSINKPNVDGYACITGFFNADYLGNHVSNDYEYYYHEGIDFRGTKGTPVISLVYGEIVCFGKTEKMQGAILMKSEKEEDLYFLAVHLDENTFGSLKQKQKIIPGTKVAEIGSYPNGDHLHVSVIKLKSKATPIGIGPTKYDSAVFKDGDLLRFPTWDPKYKDKMLNPFNHDISDKWAGRKNKTL